MLDDILADRRKKLARLIAAGVNPYPARTGRTLPVAEALAKFQAASQGGQDVAVAGRIMALRDQGGVIFLDIQDGSGQIQAVLKKENLPGFDIFQANLDRGDFVMTAGPLFLTQRGQKSIEVKAVQLLTKSLRPIPTEWYGVEDPDLRLRQRYLELLLTPETKELFRKKNIFWQTFREYLAKRQFLEVELPVLEPVPGGAEAEPFVTHHNALDTDFYLRISLELPLKKLLVGGYDAVFEIGRIFRNEGIDKEHLQDYTQLEFYWAYHDYNDCMGLVENMYKEVIERTTGGLVTTREGVKIDWAKPWPRVDYVEAFAAANGLDPIAADQVELAGLATKLGLKPEPNLGKGRLIDLIYKKTVRPKLVEPCFLIDPPVEIEPLAKRKEGKPDQVERFQVMAAGTELGKGFSELNDPLDQRARFEEQMRLRAAGDTEAQRIDEDYLAAMEYGMPPNTGFGVSERLFALLMDKPIRETVFFPLMRPERQSE